MNGYGNISYSTLKLETIQISIHFRRDKWIVACSHNEILRGSEKE